MSQFRFGIITKHYQRSLSFYSDDLGLQVINSWDRSETDKGTLFAFGNGVIEIIPSNKELPAADPIGVWLYIQVEDVDAWYQRAVEKNIPVLLKPVHEPWGHRRCKIKDPDGIQIGLFEII